MKFLIPLVVFMSLNAFAKEVGNGGDAVVCRNANGEIVRAELLDYYEGRVLRKLPVVEYPEMSDEEFFTTVGNKFNSLEDYFFKQKYNISEAIELMEAINLNVSTGMSSFRGVMFTEEELTDIPDSGQLMT